MPETGARLLSRPAEPSRAPCRGSTTALLLLEGLLRSCDEHFRQGFDGSRRYLRWRNRSHQGTEDRGHGAQKNRLAQPGRYLVTGHEGREDSHSSKWLRGGEMLWTRLH